MAAVKHTRGVKLLIKVGDGATPEVFTPMCSINAQRGISFTSTTSDFEIPDCSDPEEIAWAVREKTGLAATITGAGIVNTPDVGDMYDWLISPDPKNCLVVLDVPSADGGVIFAGAFHLTDFELTGDRGGKVETSLTLASDGEVTKAANA